MSGSLFLFYLCVSSVGNLIHDCHRQIEIGRILFLFYVEHRHKIGITGRNPVLEFIQTGNFFFSRNPQSVQFVDDEKGNQHTDRCPCNNRRNPDCLNSELPETSAIKQTAVDSEQPDRKSSPNSVCHMNRNSSHRIIDMKFKIEQLHNRNDQYTGDDSDQYCAQRIHGGTPGSNTDQTGQRGV